MSWRSQWKQVENRIEGIRVGALFLVEASRAVNLSTDGIAKAALKPAASDVLEELERFLAAYRTVMPGPAADFLKGSLERTKKNIGDFSSTPSVIAAITALLILRGEFGAVIDDREWQGRARTERAFLHLKRSIVADEDCRNKWTRAYAQSEMACEKLGAVHLLLHGIWAFKSHTPEERTDLVLQERITMTSEVETVAEALILTEWKKVTGQADAEQKASLATTQARLYHHGSLAACELTSVRYVILVSEDRLLDMPDHIGDDNVHTRYINIAVRPGGPSADAVMLSRATKSVT